MKSLGRRKSSHSSLPTAK